MERIDNKVATLVNAAAVLRFFSAERSQISVADAARWLGMPKSTTSRLLSAMREVGFLAHVGGTPRYEMGSLVFETARLYRASSTLVGIVDEQLAAICKEVGHTGYMSIRDGVDVFSIKAHPGWQPTRVVQQLGHRVPAFATATGRTLLARLSDDDVRLLYEGGLSPPSSSSPKSVSELLEALARIRRRGWEEAIDEAIAGVDSIAVSAGDPESREVLSFCVTFPPSLVSEDGRKRMVELLTRAAVMVGRKVDDPFWLSPSLSVGAMATEGRGHQRT